MSAAELREAAALMRERAEAVPDQPRSDADVIGVWLNSRFHLTMPPAVALAVADAMDQHADIHDTYDCVHEPCAHAVVARTYLGSAS